MTNQADVVVREYMERLNWRLANLPSDRREEILTDVREHIDESLPKDESATREDAEALIEQLGDPAEIANEAALRLGTLSPRPADGAGDKYMRRYLRRLNRQMVAVAPDKREEVLAEVRQQIDSSLPKDGLATREDAKALIERLGSTTDLTRDAVQRFGTHLNWRFVVLMAAASAASATILFFTDLLALLPYVELVAYSPYIRAAPKRVQAALYLLGAILTILIVWLESGSLLRGLVLCLMLGAIQLVFEAIGRRMPVPQFADTAVKRYMRRLKRRLRPLPREQREEILAGVQEHIDESLPKDGSATREDAQTLIERLGGSTEIADDAAQRFRDTAD